jgi:hypothetical protein
MFYTMLSAILVHAQCVKGYEKIDFIPFQKPKYFGAREICDLERDTISGIKYIETTAPYEATKNLEAILEFSSARERVTHLLRAGVYYGEFIEQTFNERGGNLKGRKLILQRLPEVYRRKIDDLRFNYTVDEFIWSDDRVIKVERKEAVSGISKDLSVQTKESWREYTINRRVVLINLIDNDPKKERDAHTFMSYFLDPFKQEELNLFRKFRSIGNAQPQRTILPFSENPQGKIFHAILQLYEGNRLVQTIKVDDPGDDNTELEIRLQ